MCAVTVIELSSNVRWFTPTQLIPEGLDMTVLGQHYETILVVDDEPAICKLVKTLLELEGYAVLIAGDAETASEIYEEHSDEIALLLTDLRMPEMSGVE